MFVSHQSFCSLYCGGSRLNIPECTRSLWAVLHDNIVLLCDFWVNAMMYFEWSDI